MSVAAKRVWRWLPWPVPALIVPALMIHLAGPELEVLLRYERDELLKGQLWRAFTGHFVHLSSLHLALNALALWVIMAGFSGPSQPETKRTSLVLVVLLAGVSLGLLLANPELEWYVGLSGILHGVCLLVAAALWRDERSIAVALLVGLIVKLGWEQVSGGDTFTGELVGGSVIVDAHLYGALTAAVILVVEGLTSAARKRG